MNEKITKALEKNLREGETVVWESGTLTFRLLDGKEGRKSLLQWVLSAVCYIAILIFYASYGAVTLKVATVLTALLAVMIAMPVLSYRQLLAQRYYLTNQRAILIKKDGVICTMERAKINAVRLYPGKPGASLALGRSLLDEGGKQLRWRSTHAKEHPNSVGGLNALGLVFYNVERAETAMRLLQADVERAESEAL